MEVVFASRKLEKYYLRSQEAEKKYGELVARRFIGRVNFIKAARSLEELKRAPGLRCHPLTGNRQGQWAITLVGRYRLVFEFEDDARTIVRLLEVTNHYGD